MINVRPRKELPTHDLFHEALQVNHANRGLLTELLVGLNARPDEAVSSPVVLVVSTPLVEIGPSVAESIPGPLADTPFWDARLRRLYFQGVPVKQFRQRAKNQEAVLTAFQLAGWPDRIDDPFAADDIDPWERLHNVVQRLNTQCSRRILFRRDGSGSGILWQPW